MTSLSRSVLIGSLRSAATVLIRASREALNAAGDGNDLAICLSDQCCEMFTALGG